MNLTKDLANIIKIIISEYDIDTSYDDEPYYGGFLYDISPHRFIIADRKIHHCKSPEFSIDELLVYFFNPLLIITLFLTIFLIHMRLPMAWIKNNTIG